MFADWARMRALHHSPAPFKRRFSQNGRVWSQGDEDCGLCKLILFDRKRQLSAFWYIVRASVVQCSPQSCSTAQLIENSGVSIRFLSLRRMPATCPGVLEFASSRIDLLSSKKPFVSDLTLTI